MLIAKIFLVARGNSRINIYLAPSPRALFRFRGRQFEFNNSASIQSLFRQVIAKLLGPDSSHVFCVALSKFMTPRYNGYHLSSISNTLRRKLP